MSVVFITRRGGKKSALSEVFADNSWSQIAWACQTRNIPETWVAGSEKPMLIDGVYYPFIIIGKNKDDYADGSGKAPLTFQMRTPYGTTYSIGANSSTKYAWSVSAMRTERLPAIMALMPADVQANIKEINKQSYDGSAVVTIVETLTLPSEVEVYGVENANSPVLEGTEQYDFYAAGNFNESFWTRTVASDSGSYNYYIRATSAPINGNGGTNISQTSAQNVSPIFCF